MRTKLAVAFLLLAVVAPAYSQDQEKKLIDRLLRPDLELKNSEQNKQFGQFNINKKTATRSAGSRNFDSSRIAYVRNFADTNEYSAQQFRARSFRDGDSSTHLATRTTGYSNKKAVTRAAPGIHAAGESWRENAVHDFAGSRPFLGKGRSQQALKQHDRPLTIEEVRELLNKNK